MVPKRTHSDLKLASYYAKKSVFFSLVRIGNAWVFFHLFSALAQFLFGDIFPGVQLQIAIYGIEKEPMGPQEGLQFSELECFLSYLCVVVMRFFFVFVFLQ